MLRRYPMAFSLALAFLLLAPAHAAEWVTLSGGLRHFWRCTTTPGEHWTAWARLDSDGGNWRPVSLDTPAPYPGAMEPVDQYMWPFMWIEGDVPAGKAVYFRRPIEVVAGQIAHATLKICAYGSFVAHLNGKQLLRSDETGVLHEIDMTEHLHNGCNELAIAVTRGEKNYGLLVMGDVELLWPVHESPWQVTDELGSEEQAGHPPPQHAALEGRAWTTNRVTTRWPMSEPGLELTWEDTSYPTVQPVGGMPEYSTAYFRLPFYLCGLLADGVLQILGDDSYQVYVNGHLVAVEKRADHAYLPVVVDISDYLLCGNTNVIAAKVTNDWGPGRVHIQPTMMVQF